MNLKKILEPTVSFFIDKIVKTKKDGFSRIEISDYFYTYDEWQKQCRSTSSYEKKIEKVLNILNAHPQLNYSMTWQELLDDFLKEIDKRQTLIAFTDNLTFLAYCYTKRSCRFGGHVVLKTSKSYPINEFIKRFGRKQNYVFIGDSSFLVIKDTT